MIQWLETLPNHSYDVRDAGPPTMLSPKEVSKENGSTSNSKSVADNSLNDLKDEAEIHLNSSVHTLPNVNNENMSTNEKEIKCEC